ncbi:putative transcriptional repressor Not4hp [Cryptosporidium bovis]|uniref:putative transcriptional repressor Not4hp n=1 Tax=Cryptosporidium bovis TaxID=310047 RepID=UPI00351A727A|nr:putative transcriptional repressor Not4hp [Cryptosporidium bovis]
MTEKVETEDNTNKSQLNLTSNNNELICPLCMEELDETDKNFYPCKCRYQICLWCFYHVRDQLDNKCPACRQQYDDKLTISSNRDNICIYKEEQGFNWCGNTVSRISTSSNSNKIDDKTNKNNSNCDEIKIKDVINDEKSTVNLEDMRIIQRNLVYVVGLSYQVAKKEILSCENMFGRYGKILNMRILPNDNDTCSAFITYNDELSATKAIKNTNGKKVFGQNIIRCSFGTNKYCNNFIKGINCGNPNCAYVHNIVDPNDCISKSELINFHSSNKFALKPLRELKNTVKNNSIISTINTNANNNSGSNSTSTSTICTTSSTASNLASLLSNQTSSSFGFNKDKRLQRNKNKRNVNNYNLNISDNINVAKNYSKSSNTDYSDNLDVFSSSISELSPGKNVKPNNLNPHENEMNDKTAEYSTVNETIISSYNNDIKSSNDTSSNIGNKYNSSQCYKINFEQMNANSQNILSPQNSNTPVTIQSIQNSLSSFSVQDVLFGNIKTNNENISNDVTNYYINSALDNELEFELNIKHDIEKVIDEDCVDLSNNRIGVSNFSSNLISPSNDSNFINFGSTTSQTSSYPSISKKIIERSHYNPLFNSYNDDDKTNNIEINDNKFIKATPLCSPITTNSIVNFSTSQNGSIQNRQHSDIKKQVNFNVNSSNTSNSNSSSNINTSFIDSISVLRSIMPHANITIQGQ